MYIFKTIRPVWVTKQNTLEVGVCCLLFLCAFGVRLINLDVIEHNIDRAYPVWQAMTTLERGTFPITAQATSVLFSNPALMGYLLLPAYTLTRTLYGPYIFVILLNSFAPVLAYGAGKNLGLSRLSLVLVMLLMIANPWVIEYSRLTWVQGLIPLFICLIFWLFTFIFSVNVTGLGIRLFVALVMLTMMTQTYLLAFAAVFPIGLLLFIFRDRLQGQRRVLVAGGMIFLVMSLIYAEGLLSESQQTIAQINNFAGAGWHVSQEAFDHALRLVSGADYAVARGLEAPIADSGLRQSVSRIFAYVIVFLIGLGTILSVIKLRRWHSPERDRALLILAWMWLPVLMMTFVSRVIHPFYLLLTLPAGYLLVAQGLDWLSMLRRVGHNIRMLSTLTLIGAVFPMVVNSIRYAEETRAHPGQHGFAALPLSAGIQLVNELRRSSNLDGIVFVDADEWIVSTLAGKLISTRPPGDVTRALQIGVKGSLYLLMEPIPTGTLIQDNVCQNRFTLSDGWTVQGCNVPYPETSSNQVVVSEEGMTFLGYRMVLPFEPGREAIIDTFWRVDKLQPERIGWLFAPFLHVFEDKKRIVIGDGVVMSGVDWHVGDIYVQRIRVQLSNEARPPFTAIVGLYDGVHGRNANFKHSTGTLQTGITLDSTYLWSQIETK